MRASLRIANHPQISRDWSTTRHLVLWLDPVAAGTWPNLRLNTKLNLPQRFARFLAMRSNPSAVQALSWQEIDRVDRVWRGLQKRFGQQSRQTS